MRRVSFQRAVVNCLAAALFVFSGAAPSFGHDKDHEKAPTKAPAKKPLPTVPPPVRDPEHTFQIVPQNYWRLQRQNIVLQKRDFSCGAACLATIGRYYWDDNVNEDLFLKALDELLTDQEIVDRIKNGLAMSDLRRAAVLVGYEAVVGKTTFDKLKDVKVPVVVGISPEGHDHFVVLRGTDDNWVYVADPIRGNLRMTVPDFTKQWQENAVLVIRNPRKKLPDSSPLRVRPEEFRRGELNDHLIRTQPQRQSVTPNQTLRP